jgi:hypothetical protein
MQKPSMHVHLCIMQIKTGVILVELGLRGPHIVVPVLRTVSLVKLDTSPMLQLPDCQYVQGTIFLGGK